MNPFRSLTILSLALLSLPASALEERDGVNTVDSSYIEALERATKPADIAVTFTINNRPVGYKSNASEQKQLENLAEKALKIARETYDENTHSLCSALDCAGILYYRLGDYRKSWVCLEESLALKKSGSSSREIAATSDLLAMVARARLKFENAESLYKESNQLKETEFGPNSAEAARGCVNLSNLYYDSGATEKAEQARSKALQIVSANKAVGRDIELTLTSVSLLSSAGSASLPDLTSMASTIVSAHQLALAEQNAEKEALNTMRTGIIPQRPVHKAVYIRNQYHEPDDEDLGRKRLEVAKQLIEAQENARKSDEERRKRDAEEKAFQLRQETEARVRREAEEATRKMEERQAQIQRQREAAGTGTSYFSRY